MPNLFKYDKYVHMLYIFVIYVNIVKFWTEGGKWFLQQKIEKSIEFYSSSSNEE
jgi:predicted nuclease of restriction endonuclease-like RecB superfamily